MGAQIAVWSYVIRYSMHALDLDGIIAALGTCASSEDVISALRHVDSLSSVFYDVAECLGCNALLPRTAEQAGATFYIMSLLGDDLKIGGAGMVMAIAGAAVLTQVQGIVSDQAGSIATAYWVPLVAFVFIAVYGTVLYIRRT